MHIVIKIYKSIVIAGLLLVAPYAQAKLQIFACEPEWAALAKELGVNEVAVFSATTAMQDPHHIQARPSLIAKMRRADLLICNGAGLEAGWLPVLLRRAANPAVQPGQAGYFAAADYVTLIDIPHKLDRAGGDVHPQGDPHFHTDPRNISKVAPALATRLQQLDPENTDLYLKQAEHFMRKWQQAIEGWQQRASSLRDVPVVTQHKSWSYLIKWLGLKEIARLEDKPGVPPSAVYLEALLNRLRQQPASMILRARYQAARPSEWLAERSGLPVVILPYTVGGNASSTDLFGLFDTSISLLLKAVQP